MKSKITLVKVVPTISATVDVEVESAGMTKDQVRQTAINCAEEVYEEIWNTTGYKIEAHILGEVNETQAS